MSYRLSYSDLIHVDLIELSESPDLQVDFISKTGCFPIEGIFTGTISIFISVKLAFHEWRRTVLVLNPISLYDDLSPLTQCQFDEDGNGDEGRQGDRDENSIRKQSLRAD